MAPVLLIQKLKGLRQRYAFWRSGAPFGTQIGPDVTLATRDQDR
jgi:hypothetical protein